MRFRHVPQGRTHARLASSPREAVSVVSWNDERLLPEGDDNVPSGRYRREVAASSRPTYWQDWAVPAVLFIAAQYEIWFPGVANGSGPRLAFSVVAALSAALLLLRRRRALTAALGISALMVAPMALGWFIESTSMVLMLGVSLFAAGRYAPRPAAYVAVPATALVVLLSATVDPVQGSFSDAATWSLNTVWVFALGAAFRHERVLRDKAATAAAAASRAEAAEERVRVARELHDVLTHSLSVVVIQAEVADTYLDSDPDLARQAVRRVADTARDALRDTRRMVGVLRSPGEVEPGPTALGVADVPALVERTRESGLPVTLEVSGDLPTLTAQGTAAAYRVVQESLTNVLKHAAQAPTRVLLAAGDGGVVIDVWDDGTLLHPSPSSTGVGLVGMRERVRSCGGELSCGPGTHGGFWVRAVLPAAADPR